MAETNTTGTADAGAAKPARGGKAASDTSVDEIETPTPTQAELDDAKLALGKAAPYQTREAKAG